MYQVIIIEDDPMVAAIDKQYVEADSQFRVVRTFKSGGEALAHLPELKADLIILDYYTPGMNGTEFVDQLHTLGRAPFIIAVTSANDTHIVQGLLARGCWIILSSLSSSPRFRQALDRFPSGQAAAGAGGPAAWTRAPLTSWSITGRQCLPVRPLDKGVNFSTLSRIRRFSMRTRSTSLPANRSPNMWACPYHGTPLCQLHGGSGGDHQLHRLPDREAAPPSAT